MKGTPVTCEQTIVSDADEINAHLDAIETIETSTFTPPWSRDDFLSELHDCGSRILVLIEKNTVAGYLFAKLAADELNINKLCVHRDFRGRGFGKKLLQELLDRSRPECGQAFLEVDSTNVPAVNLYTRFGFGIIRIRRKIYTNGADALEMMYEFGR